MKCVILVDENLSPGVAANTAAVLGISLSAKAPGLTGQDFTDGGGRVHKGITNIPVPVLAADNCILKRIYDDLLELEDTELTVIGFHDVARESNNYDDFVLKIGSTTPDDIRLMGLCLYGVKKKINKLTGNLKLLR